MDAAGAGELRLETAGGPIGGTGCCVGGTAATARASLGAAGAGELRLETAGGCIAGTGCGVGGADATARASIAASRFWISASCASQPPGC